MPEYQTTNQDLTAILRGSAKMEISPYQANPSWTDAGALSGIEVDETLEVNQEENDNVQADDLVTKQEITIKAKLHEALNSDIWDILRGSFDTKTVNAATETTTNQDFAANTHAANKLYILEHQNAAGTSPSVVVTKDPSGTPVSLVHETDYDLMQDSNGKWGIRFISGDAYDSAKLIRVAITYTPAASIDYESGNQIVLPSFLVRLTTKNDGSPFYVIIYKCKIKVGKKFTFPKDDDKDRRVMIPIEIVGKTDPLYHNGMVYKTNQTGGL